MEKVNLKMVGDKILVEQLKGTNEVVGIEIAEPHVKKLFQGIVISCNESYTHNISGNEVVIPCKAGDRVAYQQFAQSRVEYENKEYIVLKTDDLYFIYPQTNN